MKNPQGFHVQLNKKDISAYPDEQDVILYDGHYAKIEKVDQMHKKGTQITLIDMTYDPEDYDDEEDQNSMRSF
jgi:hypothetical protein